ncbi:phosphotransferase family protein [Streptomyces sp. NPDC055722]
MTVHPPDTHELKERLARHLGTDEAVVSLDRLPGGLSGITYLALCEGAAGTRRIVVKVAPRGVLPTGNRDVLRQAAIQQFLRSAGAVPIPAVLFSDGGDPPDIPPFYATSFLDGDSCEPLDEETSSVPAPDVLRRRYLTAARTLSRLHATATTATLFVRVPVITPGTELDRWIRAFEAVPEELQFSSARVGRRLALSTPEPLGSVLLHGDYRLGNTICVGSDVRAVIDWELWGLGDARTDLAWFLHMSDPHVKTARRQLPGVPTQDEIVRAYCGESGTEMPHLSWFMALALFKRAAATALIVKYNRRSDNPDPAKEKALEIIEPLLTAAEAAMSQTE